MIEWLAHGWFEIVQTLGIAGSLLYAAYGFHLDRRMRDTELLISITNAHRSIWERMIEQPGLGRVLDPSVDVKKAPPSPAEARFVKLVLLHLAAVHRAIQNGAYLETPEMRRDIRQFLSKPIPRKILGGFMDYQNPEFRGYILKLSPDADPNTEE